MKFADLSPAVKDVFNEEMLKHQLPDSFQRTLETGILPTASFIAKKEHAKAPIWGVCGAQGTGKSTLVHFLALCLKHIYNLRSVCLSLDDFYLSKVSRQNLGKNIHPLLSTRGVPGTHDVDLGIDTLTKLSLLGNTKASVPLPKFNKALDDCVSKSDWPVLSQQVDIILFEGWCVGTPPQSPDHLDKPCNDLEQNEDPDGHWRRYVNSQLADSYHKWFSLLDYQIFLKVPSFEQVFEWRGLQEEKLRQQYLDQGKDVPDQVMSPPQIARFIQHYERLTRWNLEVLPLKSNVVLELLKDHSISKAVISEEG